MPTPVEPGIPTPVEPGWPTPVVPVVIPDETAPT
jgi:hypothetical protein